MKILINSRYHQIRMATIQGNQLTSLIVSNAHQPTNVGSIYKGKITKIIPSLQACFVDIGQTEEAFMHVAEIQLPEKEKIGRKSSYFKQNEESAEPEGEEFSSLKKSMIKMPIEDVVKQEQMVLVQVKTDSIGSKRARLTMFISLAGRNLVYLPQSSGIGISKRIEDVKERERLKKCIEQCQPQGGVIIRTAACEQNDFKKELKMLTERWGQIQKNNRKTVGLVQREDPLEIQFVRDKMDSTCSHVYIDDLDLYEKTLQFVEAHIPEMKNKLVYYSKSEPLFKKFGVENQWLQVLKRKVYLKSGGSIVIDENEAMVNIDVNTGRFVGKKSQHETILKTNMEAVKAIASQLILRNCGGIIVIDLIDMDSEQAKNKVLKQLEKELKKDSVYTEIVSFSDLNLIQMTRKRVRESLKNSLCEVCSSCQGRGAVKLSYTVACEIFRELESMYGALLDDQDCEPVDKKASNNNTVQFCHIKIQIDCHIHVMDWIHKNEMQSLEFLKEKYGMDISFKGTLSPYIEEFSFHEIK